MSPSDVKMNVLGVIPARGGSKGIPRKNLRKYLIWLLMVHYLCNIVLAHINYLIAKTV